jgi:YesN/AraC family two-component response regulator
MIKFSDEHSFYFSHVHLHPKEQIGLHQQSTWELSYIIKGSGICRFGDTVNEFKGGEIVLLPPETPHCWNFDNKDLDTRGMIENITIVFNDTLFDRLTDAFVEIRDLLVSLKTQDCVLEYSGVDAAPFNSILSGMTNQTEGARFAGLVYILTLFSENINRARILERIHSTSKSEEKLIDIDAYINCNFKREITIEMISKFVSMNRSSFCSFFLREKGMTFVSYLNQFRIDFACSLLNREDANISEICYSSGFRDVPYFNRLFKKNKGMTPGEYRKNK